MSDVENVELDIDESSELLFKVRVEGTTGAPVSVRLVIESRDSNMMFNGRPEGHDDIVTFTLPSLIGKMNEGVHHAKIEVVVDDRLFVPVKFNVDLKKTVKVVAEALSAIRRQPTVSVSATPIVVKRSKLAEKVSSKTSSLLDDALVELFSK